MTKKKQSFEESLAQLENVVGKMEGGEIPLDECIDLYEKGVKLADFCAKELEILTARSLFNLIHFIDDRKIPR